MNKLAILRKAEFIIPLSLIILFSLLYISTGLDNDTTVNDSVNDRINDTVNETDISPFNGSLESNLTQNDSLNITLDLLENESNIEITQFEEKNITQTIESFSTLSYTDTGALTQNVNDCGTLNTTDGIYTLTANVTSNDTCFTIQANNITINGERYTVNYSANGTVGYGFNITRYNATIINNTRIVEGISTGNAKYPILLTSTFNDSILNNTIIAGIGSSTKGIVTTGTVSSIRIINNSITLSNAGNNDVIESNINDDFQIVGNYLSTSNGVVISFSDNSNSRGNIFIYNNTLSSNGNNKPTMSTGGCTGGGVNWTIQNNVITSSGATADGIGGNGLCNSSIINNTITVVSTSNGIKLGTGNNLVVNNTVTTVNGYGIYMSSSTNNTIKENKLNSSQNIGFYLTGTTVAHFNHTIDTSNLVEGFRAVYNFSVTNQILYQNQNLNNTYGQIMCGRCNNVTYINITLSNDGIGLYGTNNSQILNSTISTIKGYGAYIYSNSFNNVLDGNSILTTTTANLYGIHISTSNYTNITNNNITVAASNTNAIYYEASSNGLIDSNKINATANSGYGIYLFTLAKSNTLSNNTVITTGAASGIGITLQTTSNFNILVNNTITTSGANGYGIYLLTSHSNNISNNNITTAAAVQNAAHGIYLRDSSINILTNNNITIRQQNSIGILLQHFAYSNIMSYNNIITSGGNNYGVSLEDSTSNNSFSNMRITTNNSNDKAWYISDTSQNFTINDSILNSTNATATLLISSTVNGGTWNFTNVTRLDGMPINITWSTGANGTLNYGWYLDVVLNITPGNAYNSVNITGYNVSNNLVFSSLTNPDGVISRQTLLQYTRNGTSGAITTNYSNYTVNTTKSGTFTANSTFNLTTNTRIVFSINDSIPNSSFINPSPRLNGISSGNATINVSIIDSANQTYSFIRDGLVAWFRMDNTSIVAENSTLVYDWSGNGNNATCSGTACPTVNSSGKFNAGRVFDGANDFLTVQTSRINWSVNQTKTISLWFRSNLSGTTIMDQGTSGGVNVTIYLYLATGTSIQNWMNNNGFNFGGANLTNNIWQHLVYVYTGASEQAYLNGILLGTNNESSPASNEQIFIGKASSGGEFFNGTMDEIMIFNRSLSSAEIKALYNSSEYYLQRNYSALSGTQNISLKTIDDAGNLVTNDLIFIADAAAPNVSFTGATPNNSSYVNTTSFVINVSSNDSYDQYSFVDFDSSLVAWYRLEQNNGTFFADDTGRINGTCSGTACPLFNSSGRFGGAHSFDGINDQISTSTLADYPNYTFNFWYFVTTLNNKDSPGAPFLVESPNTGMRIALDSSGKLGIDAGGTWGFCFGGTSTLNSWQMGTIIVNTTTTSVYMNGTLVKNCTNTGTMNFSISTLKIGNDRDSYFLNQSSLDDIIIFNRSLSTSELSALYNASASKYYNNFTGLAQGNHTFTAYSVDSAGNKNTTGQYTVNLDLTIPNATLNTPSNGTYRNSGSSINLTANLTDNTGLKNATLYIYNTSGLFNMTRIANFAGNVVSTVVGVVVNFVEGIYTWFYSVFDLAGNSFTTQNNTLVIDTTAPLAALTAPSNETKLNNATQRYNVTISDNLGILNATLKIYNGTSLVNSTNVSFSESTLNSNTSISVTLADNYYNWSYEIFDIAGNNFTAENNTLVIDTLSTNFANISYSPSLEDVLDPNQNITINATVSDSLVGVNTVILQYYNGTAWINESMYSIGNNIYQANITTVQSERNYTFNIFANDSAGNNNVSSNTTFESQWDCSWNYTYSGLSGNDAFGFKESKTIGNITILNTGDIEYINNNCSLVFSMTDTGFFGFSLDYWIKVFAQQDISIKGLSYNTSLTINASQNATFLVYAGFPSVSSPLEELPNITITSNINDSVNNRISEVKEITIVVSQPGAYLRTPVIDEQPDSNIYLTEQNVTFKAYTENIGGDSSVNYTAYNVSLNWTFPDSFVLSSDSNTSLTFDEISNSSIFYYNNATVILNSVNLELMSSGVHQICANAEGYENSTGNLSLIVHASNKTLLSSCFNITLLCYNVSDSINVPGCGSLDGDYVAPSASTSSGGATSGGGGGGVSALQSRSDYTITRGKQNEIPVPFKNKNNNLTMSDLKFTVTGDIAKYITVEPSFLSILGPLQETNIILKINSPTYIALGQQTVILHISGRLGDSVYTEERKIVIQVNALPKDEVETMLDEMNSLITRLKENNLSSEKLELLIKESISAFDTLEYEKVQENYNIMKKQVESALEADKTIKELKLLIADSIERGIETRDSQRLLKLAELSIDRADFEQANSRAKDARNAFALEFANGTSKLSYYLKKNTKEIALSALTLLIISFTTIELARLQLLRRKIKKLREEEFILTQLMKLAQDMTFKQKKMEMEEYRETMLQYEKKMANVIEQIIDSETEMAHVLKFTSTEKKLKSEKETLIGLVKEIQYAYLKKGSMETRAYELKLESYNRRLGEIDEKLAELEAKKAIKSAK